MDHKDNFTVGNCKLCGAQNINLIDSHYLPSFFYSRINDIKDKNYTLNLIQSDWTKRNMGDHQITKYMLCKCCEELFNKHGETPFPNLALPVNKKNPILFVKLIRNLLPKTQKNLTLSNLNDFDNESLYYFIISMFWRSSLNWNTNEYDKRTFQYHFSEQIIEEMKLYLQKRIIPLSFKVLVIPLLKTPYHSCSLPKEFNLNGGGKYYSFNIYQYLFILLDHTLAEEKVEGIQNDKIAYCISDYFEDNFAYQFNRSYRESKTKGKKSLDVSWEDQKLTTSWSFTGSVHPLYFISGNYLIKESNISRKNTEI
ncbi:hypothetical protein [Photorhabdus luminescens]|uniref:Uncharacterized protein n=1 Tax=Photorhabdus luminescens subsp. mexicana TaxID=2100167 RepID=A0A4R4JEQ0_PHOLU|nr:hypothetical protein [Photorhabdus luminescens]TDB52226.1 hypothetical protein C5468_10845 [Photorhabdus luminescens subsp. mexicana]